MSRTDGGTEDEHVVPSTQADQLQREIEERQARLAATVDELTTRVHPKSLARNGQESVQRRAKEAVLTEDGEPRVERIVAIGSAAVAVVGAVLWRSGRRSRR